MAISRKDDAVERIRVFERVRSAAGAAEAQAELAAREIEQARERLARAQRAALGVEEAAGRAQMLLGAAVREREALGGLIPDDGSPVIEDLAEKAERAFADARVSRCEVRDALRDPWIGLKQLRALIGHERREA